MDNVHSAVEARTVAATHYVLRKVCINTKYLPLQIHRSCIYREKEPEIKYNNSSMKELT